MPGISSVPCSRYHTMCRAGVACRKLSPLTAYWLLYTVWLAVCYESILARVCCLYSTGWLHHPHNVCKETFPVLSGYLCIIHQDSILHVFSLWNPLLVLNETAPTLWKMGHCLGGVLRGLRMPIMLFTSLLVIAFLWYPFSFSTSTHMPHHKMLHTPSIENVWMQLQICHSRGSILCCHQNLRHSMLCCQACHCWTHCLLLWASKLSLLTHQGREAQHL